MPWPGVCAAVYRIVQLVAESEGELSGHLQENGMPILVADPVIREPGGARALPSVDEKPGHAKQLLSTRRATGTSSVIFQLLQS